METKLIPIGNSYGIRLPKAIIKQFAFAENNIEISIKEDGIFLKPIRAKSPISEWDNLFIIAKQAGFNAQTDAASFADMDTTLTDGE